MAALALINAGVLTDNELMRLAEKLNNATMRRIIGRALETSKEGRFITEGRRMQETYEPHLQAIDELISYGDYACGGARLSGPEGAKSFVENGTKRLPRFFPNCFRYKKPGSDPRFF